MSIDEVTVKVLTEHRLTQEQEQDHLGEAWMGVPDGFLFTTGWGERVYRAR